MSDAAPQYVFVVDDDEAIRDSLQWLLESHGLQVRHYASPQAFSTPATPRCPAVWCSMCACLT